MQRERFRRAKIGSGEIWTAIMVSLGVLSAGFGFLQHHAVPLFAGLFIMLAGLLDAVVGFRRRSPV